VVLKRSWAGEVRNVSVLAAIGGGADGHRQILGVAEGQKEDLEGWRGLLRHLKDRGLAGRAPDHLGRLPGACRGRHGAFSGRAVAALHRALLPQRVHQRSQDEGCRGGAHAQSHSRAGGSPLGRGQGARGNYETTRDALPKAAELVEARAHETLTYFAFPSNHWRQVRTNNPLERIIRQIRRRTRVVGAFPDGHSALMLVAARLRHIASTKWGKRRYLAMETLFDPALQEPAA